MSIKYFNQYLLILEETQCIGIDKDRYDPVNGNVDCCPGLIEKTEPRPTSMNNYCPTSDVRHDIDCWSTITMCRVQGITISNY